MNPSRLCREGFFYHRLSLKTLITLNLELAARSFFVLLCAFAPLWQTSANFER
jgi:hypothetical protein